jgi:ubiquinone/menaquinone biosynthesis C-methylase UbiE
LAVHLQLFKENSMSGTAPGFAELKKGMKAAWMAGDFGQIARHSERRGEEFVARLGLRPGMKVLDVACGTGNQSIPAARTGAEVTAVDIATNSLEQARKRADAEGLKIRFIEGDAEDLPAETAQFDVVCSMFGAMFAPRPELVASEMIRVCKPGGLIAMANWTPGGFVGQMFKINGSHLPPQPGVPAPTLWGEEAVVRQRFGPKVKIEAVKRDFLNEFPFGPGEVVEFFRQYFGPTQTAFAQLDAAGQKSLRDDLIRHWTQHNEGDANHTVVRAEFLEVHGHPES